jgi:serine/threonine-protein kinase
MTDAERLRRIEELFHRALERAPNEQAAFLAQVCNGDEELRREVESLLAASEQGWSGMEKAVAGLAAEWSERQKPQAVGARTLGPYQLLSLLGKGGMGEVHLAYDTRLGRKVALKLLPAEFTDHKDRLRRFEQEARTASALNHPNIITIYEIGRIDSTHFIATEFVEGQTLRRLMRSHSMELRDALEMAAQVAGALAAAHAVGITHRDIKPENLMVRPDGLVKVLDFGLAKLTESRTVLAAHDALTAASTQTEPGVVMGTAQYMSPEQARGQDVDGRADIFSLGVVLYEMITGQPPFDGTTTIDVLAAMLNREPAPLAQYNDAVPDELQRIVSKALSKDRQERYQSAGELMTELKELLRELELESRLAQADGRQERAMLLPRSLANRNTAQIEVTRTGTSEAMPTISGFSYFIRRIKRHRTSLLVVIAALVLAALAAPLIGRKFWGSKDPRQINSLAVQPFVNSGADPELEYLCDGITESLINRLSRLSPLKVMSRNAVIRYRGRETDARLIGRELGVDAVLTGRIQRRGDELSIHAELVDASDNSHIWGEKYIRRLTGALAEEEIVREISVALRLKLSAVEQENLTKRYTANTEAYHLYLKGRHIWNKRRREEFGKAIDYFNQAIEKDPAYALAWAGLADCYVLGGASSRAESAARAKAAALKALEIDETLAEAHATLGQSKLFHEWDPLAAETEFKQAIALNPNYATAHQWYADCLAVMGRTQEALDQMKLAQQLDPLSPSIIRDTGRILYYGRRYDEAIAQCRQALDLDARFEVALLTLGDALVQKRMYQEAIASYQKAAEVAGVATRSKALLAYAYAAAGNRGEAQKRLEELLVLPKDRPLPAFDLALVYTGMGMKREALEWLEKAFQEHHYRLIYIGVDPLFAPLRDDPGFADLLRRIGLPQ